MTNASEHWVPNFINCGVWLMATTLDNAGLDGTPLPPSFKSPSKCYSAVKHFLPHGTAYMLDLYLCIPEQFKYAYRSGMGLGQHLRQKFSLIKITLTLIKTTSCF